MGTDLPLYVRGGHADPAAMPGRCPMETVLPVLIGLVVVGFFIIRRAMG